MTFKAKCGGLLALGVAVFGAAHAQLPQDANDWSRIYLGSNPSVSGDGKTFAFEWNDHLWLAETTG